MRTRDKNEPPQARKNASDQAPISFSIAPDWLKGWHEFSRPQGELKQNQESTRKKTLNEVNKP